MLTKLRPFKNPRFSIEDNPLWDKAEAQVLGQVTEDANLEAEAALWEKARRQAYWELVEPLANWLEEDIDAN